MSILQSTAAQKCLTPGRVILVSNSNHHNALGVILKVGTLDSKFTAKTKDPLEMNFVVLLICDKTYEVKRMYAEDEINKNKNEKIDQNVIADPTAVGMTDENNVGVHALKTSAGADQGVDIYLPPDESGQIVEDITALCIEEIFDYSVSVDAAKIIDNHKKRMIPRFRWVNDIFCLHILYPVIFSIEG